MLNALHSRSKMQYVLEFPAGLLDAGESAEVAAVRELKEETGLTGKILSISPTCFIEYAVFPLLLLAVRCLTRECFGVVHGSRQKVRNAFTWM